VTLTADQLAQRELAKQTSESYEVQREIVLEVIKDANELSSKAAYSLQIFNELETKCSAAKTVLDESKSAATIAAKTS